MNHFIRFIVVVWNLCSNSVRCLQLRYIQNKWKCIIIFGIPFSQDEFISFFPLRCFLCKRAPCTLRGRNKHYYWSKELLYWRFTQPHRAKLDINLPWLYSISWAFFIKTHSGATSFSIFSPSSLGVPPSFYLRSHSTRSYPWMAWSSFTVFWNALERI